MNNIHTGINIGRFHIEAVQIKKTLGGYRLLKYGRADIEKEGPAEYATGVEQERIGQLRRNKIAEAVRKVLEENNIEPIQVVTCIPDSEIILRYFSMSYLPRKEWENAVRFEAQKYIPFRLDEVVSDFFVFDTKDKKKELKVVFIATKKDILSSYLDIFKEISIPIAAVEAPSLGFIRLFRTLNILSKKGITAILYVEKAEAVLTICDSNIPYLMRDFSYSSRSRTSEISGVESPQTGGENLEYENLLREIQLSFDYYYKHLPAMKIEKLILLSMESSQRWKEYLEKDLKLPVIIGSPNPLFKGQTALDSTVSTAVGLALRGFQPQEKEITLSPKEEALMEFKEALKLERPLLVRITVLELILGLSVMFLVHLTIMRQAGLIKNNLFEVRKARESLGKELSKQDRQGLLNIQNELNREKVIMGRLIDRRIFLTLQLNEIPRLLPSGVWLENLQIESKTDDNSGAKVMKLIIEGKALSNNQQKSELELINELIASIKSNTIFMTEFNKVELGFMEKGEERGFSITRFKIICSG